jgi:hypothetical protein
VHAPVAIALAVGTPATRVPGTDGA